MTRWISISLLALAVAGLPPGCDRSPVPAGGERLSLGVSFETLQTEFWVAARQAFRDECAARGIELLEAIADGNAARQLDQVRSFIVRKVGGIVVVPKDAKSVIPAIKSANEAGIPVVCFNRPPEKSEARSISVVADNYAIARATVDRMVLEARKTGGKRKAMVLIGDLGDVNSLGRRDGFEDAAKAASDTIEVVARVPTDWNNEKALAGVTNALQADPDIGFIFTSSDLHLPAIASALKTAGKYSKIGDPGHVVLGGFDGDATAYRMLQEGYLDADGVQDVYFEVSASIQAVLDARAKKDVPERIEDKGFVIHQENKEATATRMWGAQLSKS